MAYLGKYETRTADFKVYTSSTATATHTLSWTPTSKQSLRITINGVVQQDDAFSLTGNTVTLDAAILVTDVLEIVGVNELGGQVLVPADGSIQAGKLGSNAVTTAKIQDDAVTLAKMAGLARGKIIVGDASGDPSALTVGAVNQVLKSDGSDVSWGADVGGSIAWIAGADNNAAVSSIDFTDVFSATYSTYMIVFSMIKCDTTSESVFMSVGPSDLSSIRTGNYSYYFYSSTDGNTNAGNTSDSNGFRVSGGGAATEGMSGVVYIYQPFSSADRTAFTATCNGRKLNWGFNIVGGQEVSATSNESLRIKAGAGNIGSSSYNARIDIYGLKNS